MPAEGGATSPRLDVKRVPYERRREVAPPSARPPALNRSLLRHSGYHACLARPDVGCELLGGCGITLTAYAIGGILDWELEYTDEFGSWWDALDAEEQVSVGHVVGMLESEGPNLPFPYSSDIRGARHNAIRELRIQHRGRPYRVLYAFDPRRTGILLLGGKKGGNERWYVINIPEADRLFEDHLEILKREGGERG